MLQPELVEALQPTLDLNEQLLWAARPKPRFFNTKLIGMIPFSLVWLAISLTVATGFAYTVWFPTEGAMCTVNGSKMLASEVPLAMKLFITGFVSLFVIAGFAMLTCPFWGGIQMRFQIYAVTTRALLRKGLFITKRWSPSDIDFIERRDLRSGLSTIYFARNRMGGNVCTEHDGFINIPTMEADFVEQHIRALMRQNKEERGASRDDLGSSFAQRVTDL